MKLSRRKFIKRGIFTFSIFYSILIYFFHNNIVEDNYWWTLLFGISLPLSGFFTLTYSRNYFNFRDHIQFIKTQYQNPGIISELIKERELLIKDLDLSESYLQTQLSGVLPSIISALKK